MWRCGGRSPPECIDPARLFNSAVQSRLEETLTTYLRTGAPQHCWRMRRFHALPQELHVRPSHCCSHFPCHHLQQTSNACPTPGRHTPHMLRWCSGSYYGACAHPGLQRRQLGPPPRARRSPHGRGCAAAASPGARPRPAWWPPPLPGPGAALLHLQQPPPETGHLTLMFFHATLHGSIESKAQMMQHVDAPAIGGPAKRRWST